MTEPGPLPPITVTLAAPLYERVMPSPGAGPLAVHGIAWGIDERAQTVGQPPEVLLRRAEPGIAEAPLISVLSGDGRCRFATSVIAEALAYVTGTCQVAADKDAVLRALPGLDRRQATELVGLVCQVALAAQPDPSAPLAPSAAVAEPITIHVHPGYLCDLTMDIAARDAVGEEDDHLFLYVRDALSTELGLVLPPFRLIPDPALRERAFMVQVGAIRSVPRISLPSGMTLVNEESSRLGVLGIASEPTLNPATGQPASLAAADDQKRLTGLGFTTWDGTEYFFLCLAAVLRRQAPALMTPDMAADMIIRLGQAFPVLQEASDAYVPPEVLAPVLRDLLADGISVRNMRRIIDLLLRYETTSRDTPDQVSADRITFVRRGLADAIADKFALQTGTVATYLLDANAESAVAALDGSSARERDHLTDRLAAGVRAEVASLPATAATPTLLTTDTLRPPLRRALAAEFPRLAILGYGDLPPGVNVEPKARISLG